MIFVGACELNFVGCQGVCVRYDPIHTVTVWMYITNNHCECLIKVASCDICQCYSIVRDALWTQCDGYNYFMF